MIVKELIELLSKCDENATVEAIEDEQTVGKGTEIIDVLEMLQLTGSSTGKTVYLVYWE